MGGKRLAADSPPPFTLERLAWSDEELGAIAFPRCEMRLRSSFGSGLARSPGDPPDIVWAVGDRGPNLKVKTLVEHYGAEAFRPHLGRAGTKVMPRPDVGPAIARLRVGEDRVELLDQIRLRGADGRPVSGLPIPGGEHARREPALDLDGKELAPDPSGFDTEGIAAAADGGFWIGDEFGPSLVRVDSEGVVRARVVPKGVEMAAAGFEVLPLLPAIAANRHINRGFEALAASADGRWLFVAFQSPLAFPDVAAHRSARHVRLWRLDARSLEVAAQYLYPLDPPEHFRRDWRTGPVERTDIKVSELAWIGEDELLVLERASRSTRIYRIRLDSLCELPAGHLDPSTRPTVEQLSPGDAFSGVELAKHLLFDTDEAEQVPPDLEGMVVIAPNALLLVNDNDFGVEGARTEFWKVVFSDAIFT